jgi:hypothetical protein
LDNDAFSEPEILGQLESPNYGNTLFARQVQSCIPFEVLQKKIQKPIIALK